MNLDEIFGIGRTITLGSHRFEADEIKAFAAKYDPQPFHLSEESAERSVFGALCASGWHTMAIWMRHNVAAGPASIEAARAAGATLEFGPAAGLRNLRWTKPVHVGDTIIFTRTPMGHRPLVRRPGWRLISSRGEAVNQRGESVMVFDALVLMKAQ